ncbi:MAG: (2,3-dihydroxybenzoyl)adenylate synthase [Polyangiales bacterium]
MIEGCIDWPVEFAEKYRARRYWSGRTITGALEEIVEAHGSDVAVVDGGRRITYDELGRSIKRMAHHLSSRNISCGARIIFQLPNVAEFVICYFAALTVGAIPVACLPQHRDLEVRDIARLAGALAWFVPSPSSRFDHLAMIARVRDSVPTLREIFALGGDAHPGAHSIERLLDDPIETRSSPAALAALQPFPSDCAVFQLSGGTTGTPKIIPRTHDDYLYNSLQFARVSGLSRDSVLLISLPIAHNFPLACPGLQGALLLGARVVLCASPSADLVFPLIEAERVTWVPAVPASVINWANDPRRDQHDLTSIRAIYVGGQRLHQEPAERVTAAFGPVVNQVFGMAEGLLCCTRPDDPSETRLGTQGRPICPDDELRIVDEQERDVSIGAVGHLLCRGPYTIRGYYAAEAHNSRSFTGDGFYRTGDLVRMTDGGNLVVEGRNKDVINRGGEKISAEEIESLILTHSAVHNVAVVAFEDEILGERACAFVILNDGATLSIEELLRFLCEEKRAAKYKCPERLEIRTAFPLTAVGKVSKKDLRLEVALLIETERGATNANV